MRRKCQLDSMLHDILSPEIKFHFCQNNCSEITLAMSLISGYFMKIVMRLKKIYYAQNEISCKN